MEEQSGKKTELTCIRCPIGCALTVTEYADGVLHVAGNTCGGGEEYGKKELKNPTRILTTTVRVKNGSHPIVPVKTRTDIPKGKIGDCMKAVKRVEVEAPVYIGDVVLTDAAGTGVDIVATKNVEGRG